MLATAPGSTPKRKRRAHRRTPRVLTRSRTRRPQRDPPRTPGGSRMSRESLAHRLLKVELASAIREARWDARLDVAGDGWRADVLATHPASSAGIAWQAQLSSQTVDVTSGRTATLAASDVEVWWVTAGVRMARGGAVVTDRPRGRSTARRRGPRSARCGVVREPPELQRRGPERARRARRRPFAVDDAEARPPQRVHPARARRTGLGAPH